MKEILFKAKRIGDGKWVEGNVITRKYFNTNKVFEAFIVTDAYEQLGILGYGVTPTLISPMAINDSDGFFRVDKDTICQYTGLTDKNGSKIWENDIVEIPREDDFFRVEWQEDTASFVMNNDSFTVTFDNYWSYEVEVYENIFDNPELIKEEF